MSPTSRSKPTRSTHRTRSFTFALAFCLLLDSVAGPFQPIPPPGKAAASPPPKIQKEPISSRIASFVADPKVQDVSLYWKDDSGEILRSILHLKRLVEIRGRHLQFATNGGMFNPGFSPRGLFVQHHQILSPLDTGTGAGNFHLQPNGVFYLTVGKVPVVCKTGDFPGAKDVEFATQSGPMLVSDGEVNPAFTEGSQNLYVRSGVGVLPDGKVVFAISKTEINFFDFASYFKSLGAKNALYLDGFVSRAYIPSLNRLETDGDFGVMIGVTDAASETGHDWASPRPNPGARGLAPP